MNSTHSQDPTAESRKKDHIELAFRSQVETGTLDERFAYEPMLTGHPDDRSWPAFSFLGKTMRYPIWVSSMTGGTEWARTINMNLAKACKEFGIGMGLGSCRSLLYGDEFLADFDVREAMGEEAPLFANLGIAQVEELLEQNKLGLIDEMVNKLRADGLIVHVNPMQEWMQPEGDRIRKAPIDTIKRLLDKLSFPIIVKEVGQGYGPESIRALLQLPLAAIDFAANGGTNFALLELLRSEPEEMEAYGKLALIGHSAPEMVKMTNEAAVELGPKLACRQVIISGGVKDFLDGYYLIGKSSLPAVYGQASAFLKHARGDYSELRTYIERQIKGLDLSRAFLKVR
jgi:isopentenyl-diphosphate delta-isomerase